MEAIINPRENQPIIVSAETKEVADVFMTTIGEMFETIEMLAGAERPMNEGEWLVLAKQFQKLATMKERTVTTVVYVEQERTHRRGRVMARKPMTKAEKLKDENFMMCPCCKKVMTKRHYSEKHKKSGICGHIEAVENIASHNKAEVKSNARRVKISDKPIIVKEMVYKKKEPHNATEKERDTKTDSIAYRSLILAELFKPQVCHGLSGAVSIPLPVEDEIDYDSDSDDEEERPAIVRRYIRFNQFNPNEIGKYTQNEETGKWVLDVPVAVEKPKTVRIKLKVKQPKKKLVVVETVCEKCHLIECCCEADRLQVLADDARARAEGFMEVDGRWIKRDESRA